MLLAEDIPVVDVLNCIRSLKEKEIVEVDVFDLYRGEHVPSGQKSVAVRVRYRSPERTLTDEEVNRLHLRIIDNLIKKLNVFIR